jgi:ABC-type molybdenum transport system ATPase subunit/photorepair protein PhrA
MVASAAASAAATGAGAATAGETRASLGVVSLGRQALTTTIKHPRPSLAGGASSYRGLIRQRSTRENHSAAIMINFRYEITDIMDEVKLSDLTSDELRDLLIADDRGHAQGPGQQGGPT